ncbi:RnfH family protein [Gammaproteobacteria bacterium]|nr:RnfH family protein [Gammaproteobacteria bacterium]
MPSKYRLREGERVEILRPLVQDPKERRLNKV